MDEINSPSPKESLLDLQEIRQIVDLMAQNELSYFNLKVGSFKIKLRRGSDLDAAKDLLSAMPVASPVVAPAAAPSVSIPVENGGNSAARATASAESGAPTINSPMVGTFYRASSPGEKSFINVGDAVEEGTTVCIIEAMKVMNEIKAEARGTIARVLAEDGKPVQYGQPLFELK
ncbi:MAG TPA: acetyl-CoA carboxylase biotin carboxyl carrier protein [Verrucomicrobiaceae bacterium]|jgi:acetyl-CoA carboxylase biotin carboxyl carrier protein